jgi:hypothetical protein
MWSTLKLPQLIIAQIIASTHDKVDSVVARMVQPKTISSDAVTRMVSKKPASIRFLTYGQADG